MPDDPLSIAAPIFQTSKTTAVDNFLDQQRQKQAYDQQLNLYGARQAQQQQKADDTQSDNLIKTSWSVDIPTLMEEADKLKEIQTHINDPRTPVDVKRQLMVQEAHQKGRLMQLHEKSVEDKTAFTSAATQRQNFPDAFDPSASDSIWNYQHQPLVGANGELRSKLNVQKASDDELQKYVSSLSTPSLVGRVTSEQKLADGSIQRTSKNVFNEQEAQKIAAQLFGYDENGNQDPALMPKAARALDSKFKMALTEKGLDINDPDIKNIIKEHNIGQGVLLLKRKDKPYSSVTTHQDPSLTGDTGNIEEVGPTPEVHNVAEVSGSAHASKEPNVTTGGGYTLKAPITIDYTAAEAYSPKTGRMETLPAGTKKVSVQKPQAYSVTSRDITYKRSDGQERTYPKGSVIPDEYISKFPQDAVEKKMMVPAVLPNIKGKPQSVLIPYDDIKEQMIGKLKGPAKEKAIQVEKNLVGNQKQVSLKPIKEYNPSQQAGIKRVMKDNGIDEQTAIKLLIDAGKLK